MTDPAFDVAAYIHTLRDFGIAAYGFGFGAYLEEVPDDLVRACSTSGLPLLLGPNPTPFRTINEVFGKLQMKDQSAELMTPLDRQSALIEASASDQPITAVLGELAAMGNWAAYVGPTGNMTTVMPTRARKRAKDAAQELQTLGHRQDERNRGLQAAILHLLVLGSHSAAFALSARLMHITLPDYGRLFVFRAPSTADVAILAEHLELLTPETHGLLRTDDTNREVWILLGLQESEEAVATIREHLRTVNPHIKAAVNQSSHIHELASMATVSWTALNTCTENWVDLSRSTLDGVAEHIVQILSEYTRADLIPTMRTYLKHRGEWENAAQELDVHRNTLCHRMAVVAKLTQVDFDDPDIASVLWLRLRGEPPLKRDA